MKLASHNSWSFLTPRKWRMKLIRFTARCQDADIKTQYEKYEVRCFDLRLRFKGECLMVVHGPIEYSITEKELVDTLKWLNGKKNVAIRILLDVRSRRKYTSDQRDSFKSCCMAFEHCFPSIKFWNGENLFNKQVEYEFNYHPSCCEKCASVCPPKIDDWYPRWFAKRNNKKIREEGTDADFLMIDFVNY